MSDASAEFFGKLAYACDRGTEVMREVRCDHCGLIPEERGERMIVVDGLPHCEECAKFWADERLRLGKPLDGNRDLS